MAVMPRAVTLCAPTFPSLPSSNSEYTLNWAGSRHFSSTKSWLKIARPSRRSSSNRLSWTKSSQTFHWLTLSASKRLKEQPTTMSKLSSTSWKSNLRKMLPWQVRKNIFTSRAPVRTSTTLPMHLCCTTHSKMWFFPHLKICKANLQAWPTN